MFCFFFQAEDGIRDIGVTGVQTCALQIYLMSVEFVDSLLCIFKEMVLESRVLTVVMVAIEYGRVGRYFKFQEKWINMHLS